MGALTNGVLLSVLCATVFVCTVLASPARPEDDTNSGNPVGELTDLCHQFSQTGEEYDWTRFKLQCMRIWNQHDACGEYEIITSHSDGTREPTCVQKLRTYRTEFGLRRTAKCPASKPYLTQDGYCISTDNLSLGGVVRRCQPGTYRSLTGRCQTGFSWNLGSWQKTWQRN